MPSSSTSSSQTDVSAYPRVSRGSAALVNRLLGEVVPDLLFGDVLSRVYLYFPVYVVGDIPVLVAGQHVRIGNIDGGYFFPAKVEAGA